MSSAYPALSCRVPSLPCHVEYLPRPCHVERSRDISICRALPCLRRSLHALTLGRDDKMGKRTLGRDDKIGKPLVIIGSLDDMITFSDPVITRPRDYRPRDYNTKEKCDFSPILAKIILSIITICWHLYLYHRNNQKIFLKYAKKLVILRLQPQKRMAIWKESLHRGQLPGPHFLTCGPDSRTHLQYRITSASVWYVSWVLLSIVNINIKYEET